MPVEPAGIVAIDEARLDMFLCTGMVPPFCDTILYASVKPFW
jgi:hypothetical protein